jgi:hypothetical protein
MFKFKTHGKADREFAALWKLFQPIPEGEADPGPYTMLIEDDFGHKRAFWSSDVQNVALIDMEGDMDSQAQVAVLQARAQAQANRAVQADPALRLATMSGGQLLQS